MTIRVTGVDARGIFSHSYSTGKTVVVQDDGTLVVLTEGTGTKTARTIGAYPAGKWQHAYNPDEFKDESE